MTQPPDRPGQTPRLATNETGDPAPPHVPAGSHNDLGEPEAPDSPEEHGRIGYGRLGKYTPFALALVIIVVLIAIGISQARGHSGDEATIPMPETPQVGNVAPDFGLTRFDGSTVTLSSLRGSVVLVNFWTSWCPPCREEIPELTAAEGTVAPDGSPVRVMGVGLTSDDDADARRMATELGVNYPIGRDPGDPGPAGGPIQNAFGIVDWYIPATVIVSPDGRISAVHYGPMDGEMIRHYVDEAVG